MGAIRYKIEGLYVVSKDTYTIEPFDPEKHPEFLADIHAAYMTLQTKMPYRVIGYNELIPDEILSAAQIAGILGVSRQVAYNMMSSHDFPSLKLGTSSRSNKRVFRSDLMKWLKERRK